VVSPACCDTDGLWRTRHGRWHTPARRTRQPAAQVDVEHGHRPSTTLRRRPRQWGRAAVEDLASASAPSAFQLTAYMYCPGVWVWVKIAVPGPPHRRTERWGSSFRTLSHGNSPDWAFAVASTSSRRPGRYFSGSLSTLCRRWSHSGTAHACAMKCIMSHGSLTSAHHSPCEGW
jgi:hypothetical protein